MIGVAGVIKQRLDGQQQRLDGQPGPLRRTLLHLRPPVKQLDLIWPSFQLNVKSPPVGGLLIACMEVFNSTGIRRGSRTAAKGWGMPSAFRFPCE